MNGVVNATAPEVAVTFVALVALVELASAGVSVTTPVEVLVAVPVIVSLVEVRLPVSDDDSGRIVDVPSGIEEEGVVDTTLVVGDAKVVGFAGAVAVTEAGFELVVCRAARRGPGAPTTRKASVSIHARDFMTVNKGIGFRTPFNYPSAPFFRQIELGRLNATEAGHFKAPRDMPKVDLFLCYW